MAKSSFPTLANRFVEGKIIEVKSNVLECSIVQMPQGQSTSLLKFRAYIHTNQAQLYKIGQKVEAFLTRNIHGEKGYFYASVGELVDEENNPWLQKSFSVGDTVRGEVIQFINQEAAILQLQYHYNSGLVWDDVQLEAKLYRENTPDSEGNIERHLQVGDELDAVIDKLDEGLLDIRLDINNLISERLDDAGKLLAFDPESSKKIIRQSKQFASNQTKLEGKSLLTALIIDDEREQAKIIQKQLRDKNIKGRYITDEFDYIEAIDQEITKENVHFDLILIDFNLGEKVSTYEREKLYKKVDLWSQKQTKKTEVGIITGNLRIAEKLLQQIGLTDWPIFAKPIDETLIRDWMDGNLPTDFKQQYFSEIVNKQQDALDQVTDSWRAGISESAVVERCKTFLKRCNNKINSKAVYWIVKRGEGRYDIRVREGDVKEGSFDGNKPSAVVSCLENGIVWDGEIDFTQNRDPLQPLAKTSHYIAVPYKINDEYSRCLLFFGVDIFRADQIAYLQTPEVTEHIADLVQMLRLVNQVEQASGLAAVGMRNAFVEHEMRNLLGKLKPPKIIKAQLEQKSSTITDNALMSELQDYVQRVVETGSKIKGLLEGSLGRLRKQDFSIINLPIALSELCKQANLSETDTGFRLVYEENMPLWVSLPLHYLEMAFINLLDNAKHHNYKSHSPVIITIEPRKSRYDPIVITVRDFARGIHKNDQLSLFEPLVTNRTKTGTGLGLFLVRHMLQQFGAEIRLNYSQVWLGSKFEIILPASLQTVPPGKEV